MTMEYYRKLQVGTIFEIFTISMIGFCIPLLITSFSYSKDLQVEQILESDSFRIVRGFSTGVIIGLAIMHLLNDASTVDLLGNGYPMTFAIALLGILLLLGFEQLTIHAMTYVNDKQKLENEKSVEILRLETNVSKDGSVKEDPSYGVERNVDSEKENHNHSGTYDEEKKSNSIGVGDSSNVLIPSKELSFKFDHPYQEGHAHAHAMHLIHDDNKNRSFVKALIMEGSIAVHSVIIGFAFGAYGAEDITTIQALMFAYAFHQFVEGISLGVAVALAKFDFLYTTSLALFFALTLPVGIILGMTTTTTRDGNGIKDIANAFAAGTLLYNGMIEMAAEDFSDPKLSRRPLLKFQMFTAAFLGAFCMALIANWA